MSVGIGVGVHVGVLENDSDGRVGNRHWGRSHSLEKTAKEEWMQQPVLL